MDNQIVEVFCSCDDMLKAMYHHEDSQCQMSKAEVTTMVTNSAFRFRSKFATARHFLYKKGCVPQLVYFDNGVDDAIHKAGLRAKSMRKSDSKRPFPPWIFSLQTTIRKLSKPLAVYWNVYCLNPFIQLLPEGLN